MGKYSHGKQTTTITFKEFQEVIESAKTLRDKSFLAFLYWFGTRRSEAYERVKKDFETEEGYLVVHCPSKKHGRRERLKAPFDLPYIDLIIEQVKATRKTKKNPGRRVWNISASTAWRIVKRVMPHHYPHFFRLNRAVAFLNDSKTTIPEMQAWFGWTDVQTINKYLGFSDRHLKIQADRLRKDLEISK